MLTIKSKLHVVENGVSAAIASVSTYIRIPVYALHPSITKGKLACDTVKFANAMVVFSNAETP